MLIAMNLSTVAIKHCCLTESAISVRLVFKDA